jgi:HEAT repeat protein
MSVLALWPGLLAADEPRTFYGKTVAEWTAIVQNCKSTVTERQQAIHALAAFGPEARTAVPILIEALKQDATSEVAIATLTWIGAAAEHTVPLLIEQFNRQGCLHLTGAGAFGYSNTVRDALVRIGEHAVPALIGVLKGPNREMRVCAADALGRFGPAARTAIPALVDAIEHPEANDVAEILTRHSVLALGRIGPEAKAAVPALMRLLEKDGRDESDVVGALSRIGAPPVRSLLDRFLHSGDSLVAQELASLGPKAALASPALRKALADRRPNVRFSAASALAFIDPAVAELIPVLIDALDHLDDEESYFWNVPAALAHLGPRARAALPKLAGLVTKGSPHTDAYYALAEIDIEGERSVPALISALGSHEIDVIDVAANSLALLGPRAKAAVPALARLLTGDHPRDEGIADCDPNTSAAKALRRIGPEARSAVPKLIEALKFRRTLGENGFDDGFLRTDYSTATAAAETLGALEEAAGAAVPALLSAVQNREKDDAGWSVREAAILALGQIGQHAIPAVPLLRKLLKDNESAGRYAPAILVALNRLAPDEKSLAEDWLKKHFVPAKFGEMYLTWSDLAMVLGAMGRTSFETDWQIRRYIDALDSQFAEVSELRGRDVPMFMEEWFEKLGRCGPAARAAIPRLNKYLSHPSPFVRLWASEALQKIAPPIEQSRNTEPDH